MDTTCPWCPQPCSNHFLAEWPYKASLTMPNLYEVLGISPYATQQEIETALQQQQRLGNVPTQMLTLAATTLLAASERQNYDQQLMAMALGDFHASENTSPFTQQNQALSDYQADSPAHPSDDDIVFYDGLHHPPRLFHSNDSSHADTIASAIFDADTILSTLGDIMDFS